MKILLIYYYHIITKLICLLFLVLLYIINILILENAGKYMYKILVGIFN